MKAMKAMKEVVPLTKAMKSITKKPAKAEPTKADTEMEDMDNKYKQAMVLTRGDEVLARSVLNDDRYKHNACRDCLAGPVDDNLKQEWASVTTCGFGNQKKLNLQTDLFFCIAHLPLIGLPYPPKESERDSCVLILF